MPRTLARSPAHADRAPADPMRRRMLGASAALAATFALPAAAGATGLGKADRPGYLPAYLEGLRLVDQHGRPFTPRDLTGGLTLMQFIYTRCATVCPVQTRALVELDARLPAAVRERVRLVSISLDPLSDSPETLRAYATRIGADRPNWRFVTGRPTDVERLVDALALIPDAPRPGQPVLRIPAGPSSATAASQRTPRPAGPLASHQTALWLLDPDGEVRQRYAGDPVDLSRLQNELAALAAVSAMQLVRR